MAVLLRGKKAYVPLNGAGRLTPSQGSVADVKSEIYLSHRHERGMVCRLKGTLSIKIVKHGGVDEDL